MMVLLPERDPLDLEAIDFVMAELAPPDGIIFTHLPSEPGYAGMTLTEIAAAREQRPSEAFSALAQLSILTITYKPVGTPPLYVKITVNHALQ